MKKKEFEKQMKDLMDQIGRTIDIEHESFSDFDLGCFFDEETKEWTVYQNLERGRHIIYLKTKEEEEAFDRLFSMIDRMIKQRNK